MIPKIIHYCWLSNDPIPSELREYFDTWKKKLVGYEFIKWDFSKFDKETSFWVAEAYDNKKYAFAADYIRLFAVYEFGGIYLDMDMEVLKSFDDLLEQEYMFAVERPKKPWIEAGCFGAEKGNYFIKKCLAYYEGRHFVKGDGTYDMLPLPQVMEKVRKENNINLRTYPWQFFTAKSYHTGKECPNDKTYCIHHFAGSWKTDDEKEVLILAQKYSKYLGWMIGHNLAQYQLAIKKEGVVGVFTLTKDKMYKKIVLRGRK